MGDESCEYATLCLDFSDFSDFSFLIILCLVRYLHRSNFSLGIKQNTIGDSAPLLSLGWVMFQNTHRFTFESLGCI